MSVSKAKSYYRKDVCAYCGCVKEVRVLAKDKKGKEYYICRYCDIKNAKVVR